MAYENGPECRASCKVFKNEAHRRGMNGKVSSLSTFEIAFTDQSRTRAGTPWRLSIENFYYIVLCC